MSPTDAALLALAVAVLVAGLFVASAVRQAGNRLGNLSHLDHINAQARRLAIAGEMIADEQPAQKQARHYQDMSEKLILGISAVLAHELDHPEGMKDDVILGRTQGADIVKTLLQEELTNAQK